MAVQMRHRWIGPDPCFEDGLWWIASEQDFERAPIAVVDSGDDHHAPTRAKAGEIALQIVRAVNAHDELVAELENIANADPAKWEPDMRGQFREWAQSRARAALAKVRS
jgi:hypothetical protein